MKTSIVVLILALAIPAAAQPHKKYPKIPWESIAADSLARGIDAYSTTEMLREGCHELFLPDAIAHHPVNMIAFSTGIVVVNTLVASRLNKHRHHNKALVLLYGDALQNGFWGVHNLTLNCKRGTK